VHARLEVSVRTAVTIDATLVNIQTHTDSIWLAYMDSSASLAKTLGDYFLDKN